MDAADADGRYGLMTIHRSVELQQNLLRRCRVTLDTSEVTHHCLSCDDRQGWVLLADQEWRKHPTIPGEPFTRLLTGYVGIQFVEWER